MKQRLAGVAMAHVFHVIPGIHAGASLKPVIQLNRVLAALRYPRHSCRGLIEAG